MTTEIHDAVVAIDSFIRQHLWFDFRVASYDGSTLVVTGSTDFSYYHELEIHFHRVFFVSAYFGGWHSDTQQPVFGLPEPAEAYQPSRQLGIEQGFQLFQFRVEDYPNPVLIAAEHVSYSTDTVLYYYREDLQPGVRLADFVIKPKAQ